MLVWHNVVAPTDSSQASTYPSWLASSHQPCQNSIRVSPDPPQSQTQQTQHPVINIQRGGIIFSPPPPANFPMEISMRGPFLTMPHTPPCFMCVASASKPPGGTTKPDLPHGYCTAWIQPTKQACQVTCPLITQPLYVKPCHSMCRPP